MKKQVVNIDFIKDQGMILKWNYIDLSRKNKFYRHILVMLTNDKQLASSAFDNYIKHVKLGDLYSALYCNARRVVRMGEWREKTSRSVGSTKPYIGEELSHLPY